MSVTREDVIRYIENLSSDELGELVEEIQQRLGLPPLPRPTSFRLDGAAVPSWEDAHAVFLVSAGPEKLQVIKQVRETLGLGLSEARARVEQAPCFLLEDRTREEAAAFAAALAALGAQVELRASR